MRATAFALALLSLACLSSAVSWPGVFSGAYHLHPGDSITYGNFTIFLEDQTINLAAVRVFQDNATLVSRAPLSPGGEVRTPFFWVRFEGSYMGYSRLALVSPGYDGPTFVNDSIPVIQVTPTPSPGASTATPVATVTVVPSPTATPRPSATPKPTVNPTAAPSPTPLAAKCLNNSVEVQDTVKAGASGAFSVVDSNCKPVPGAKVEVVLPDESSYVVVTSADGHAEFQVPGEGTYRLGVVGSQATPAMTNAVNPVVYDGLFNQPASPWSNPIVLVGVALVVLLAAWLAYKAYKYHEEGYDLDDAREYVNSRFEWLSEKMAGVFRMGRGEGGDEAQTSLEYVIFLGAGLLFIVIILLVVRNTTVPQANTAINGSIQNLTTLFNAFNNTTA